MLRWLKRIGLGLAGFIGLLVLAGLVAFAADPVLIGRYAAVMTGADSPVNVDTLSPLETVKGAAGPPIAGPEGPVPPGLQAAVDAMEAPLGTQSLLVWSKGRLVLEWYAPGANATSTSNPASMMKPVLALAVGAAVDRGLMELDAPLGRYIKAWAGDPRGEITVRQALSMSTGLKHAPFSLNPWSRYITIWLSRDVNAVALASERAGAPGKGFQYGNVNTQLVTMALEAATGRRLADWLSETVWAPIGAGDAAVWLDRPGGAARGYCCLVATARDWLRVGLLIKDGGRAGERQVVSSTWIDAMTAPSPANPNFGMNIWRASPHAPLRSYGPAVSFKVPAAEPFLADDMVFFDGNGGQRVYVSRAKDLVIVRIGAARMDWDDAVLPNLVVKALEPGGAGSVDGASNN
jgi:CubicO group peptidase (beta-lactamase class C family)